MRIGYLDARAFPLATSLVVLQPLTNVILYYFFARLVAPDPELIGSDYFTYALIGVLVLRTLGAGLDEFGLLVQRTIDQGQLDLYLAQPLRSIVLPFAWLEWPLVLRTIGSVVTIALGLVLGAHLVWDQALLAAAIMLLGVLAAHTIGVAAASVRILAKRADPVLLLITIATSVCAGLFVPVQLLPGPLQAASWLIPHTYVADALRQLLYADGFPGARLSVGASVAALLAYTVVGYALALTLFVRIVAFARRHGLVGAQ
jgi:ABC-2 type transport system permease protein